jgi:hypothetical protein
MEAIPDVPVDEEFEGEIRCGGTLLGIIRKHHGIRCWESKCHHIKCTKGKAVAVFHYHSLQTGDLVDTVIFQDAARRFKR